MNETVNQITPAPVVKRNTLQLFKDSWRGFSKKQKYQLVAIFALVLGLPVILGGVYTAKMIGSRASEPATPPITPPYWTPTPIPSKFPTPTSSAKPTLTPTPKATLTPTPTVKPRTPTPTPKSLCGNICQTSAGCSAGLVCYQPPMPPCTPDKACAQVMPAKVCRNPSCLTNTNCICGTPTPTPKPTIKPIPTVMPTVRPTPVPQPLCKFQLFGFCFVYAN